MRASRDASGCSSCNVRRPVEKLLSMYCILPVALPARIPATWPMQGSRSLCNYDWFPSFRAGVRHPHPFNGLPMSSNTYPGHATLGATLNSAQAAALSGPHSVRAGRRASYIRRNSAHCDGSRASRVLGPRTAVTCLVMTWYPFSLPSQAMFRSIIWNPSYHLHCSRILSPPGEPCKIPKMYPWKRLIINADGSEWGEDEHSEQRTGHIWTRRS